jgi:phosphoribosylamine--glycine ligase
MRLLVIGGGAREHALVATLRRGTDVGDVLCAPGNPGIASIARCIPAELGNLNQLFEIAVREQIDLTVVGPELPLSLGIADRFAAEGRRLVGPTRAAAALESSKAFAKAFMARHRVPTARFQIADTIEAALTIVQSPDAEFPIVLKADGLAAGKGVTIANDRIEAERAIAAAMRDRRFGAAGERLVIEEHLSGAEVSFFVLTDGVRAVPIGTAQDHKRVFDDDRGPNTGGMGAFAASPLVDTALQSRIMREIVEPVIDGMAAEGYPFRGFLYVGLMLTASGPRVIEFNVRLGDPEAQVILPLIDEPLLPMLVAAADGDLRQPACRLHSDRLVGVVLASRGYPGSSSAGQVIRGLNRAERIPGVAVFHAGTARGDGQIITAGGRVVTVVGRASDFAGAIERAYEGVAAVSFEGMQYRRDIGKRALMAENRSRV